MTPIVASNISVSTFKKPKTNLDQPIETNGKRIPRKADKMSSTYHYIDKKTHLSHIFVRLKMRLW